MLRYQLLIFFTVIVISSAYSQRKVFIKPNVVFSMDTNKVRIVNTFGNLYTAEMLFCEKNVMDSTYTLLIGTSHQIYSPNPKTVDSLLDISIMKFSKDDLLMDTFEIFEPHKVIINDYSGIGFVAKMKIPPYSYASTISVTKYLKNEQINIFSTYHLQEKDSLETSSKLHENNIASVIDSLELYSQNEMDSLKELLSQKYKVLISELELRNNYRWAAKVKDSFIYHSTYNKDSVPDWVLKDFNSRNPYTFHLFRGQVNLNPQPSIVVMGIRSEDWMDRFVKDESGNFIFTSQTKGKGKIKKQCIVTFQLDNGLLIEVPYEVRYRNR